MESTSQFVEYRKKAHSLIPGGAHTYSKGDDQFPLNAPPAITKGEGAFVWGIDNERYLDCSMGLTSVSLGHAYPEVLDRVREELVKGSNFQRPAVIELEMAEAFLKLVPCHDMIKFSKNGSTATTAAVKLCRAFNGRKYVAYPKDHPFFSYDDWFIGTTACSKGVPEEHSKLSLSYDSRDLKTLEKLFRDYPDQISCIISEPEKPLAYPEGYLKSLIELCHDNGALFIQDEMVTGFKVGFPGALSKYSVEPDLATWGKGIANGFSFCALTGKRAVMECGGIDNEGSERVFLISSTHGAETHSLAAGLATIKEFQEKDVWSHNQSIGKNIIEGTNCLISKYKLNEFIIVSDSPWLVTFSFMNQSKNADLNFKTLFLQEMIKNKVLFQGSFVPCYSHKSDHVDFFLKAFEASLKIYVKAIEEGCENLLEGRPVKTVFRKHN